MSDGIESVYAQTLLDTMVKAFAAIQTEFSKTQNDIEVRIARPGDFDDVSDGDFEQAVVAGENLGIYDFDPIQRPYAALYAGIWPGTEKGNFNFIRIKVDELIAREWFGGMFNDPEKSLILYPDPIFALRSKTVITDYNMIGAKAAARFFPQVFLFLPKSGGAIV